MTIQGNDTVEIRRKEDRLQTYKAFPLIARFLSPRPIPMK